MNDLVKYPVITEKSCRLIEKNKYTFDIDLRLTKTQIKKMFEKLFNVKIIAINTQFDDSVYGYYYDVTDNFRIDCHLDSEDIWQCTCTERE